MSHAERVSPKHRKPIKHRRKDQLIGYYRELVKSKNRQDNLEDRLELVERNRIIEQLVKQVAELRERLDRIEGKSQPTESATEKEYEAVYEEHEQELLEKHKGMVVAIDLGTRSIVGIGKDIDDAYENAVKAMPDKDQFYFRRVGKPYVQRL